MENEQSEIECDRCGRPAEYKSVVHHFCCECLKKYLDIVTARDEYTCKMCNVKFTHKPVIVKYFPGLYCSEECAFKYNRYYKI